MKKRSLLCAILLITAATSVQAAEITRYQNADPSFLPILQGVVVPPNSELFYLSGQVASPIDPAKPAAQLTPADFGDTKTQTVSILNTIKGILESHGYKMSDLIKMTVFCKADPKLGTLDFYGMNDGFKQFFNTRDNPHTVARSAVQVAALANPNFLLEIEVVAAKAPAPPKAARR